MDNFDENNLLYVSKKYENDIRQRAKELLENNDAETTQKQLDKRLNSIITELNDKLDFIVNKIDGVGGVDAYVDGVHTQIDEVVVDRDALIDASIRDTTSHPSSVAFKYQRSDTKFPSLDFINQKIPLTSSSKTLKIQGMGQISDDAHMHSFTIPATDKEYLKVIEFGFMYKQRPDIISYTNGEKIVTPTVMVNRYFSGRFFVIRHDPVNAPKEIVVKAIIENSDNTGNVIDRRIFDIKEYSDNSTISYIFDNGPQFDAYFGMNSENDLVISIGKIVPYRFVVEKRYIDAQNVESEDNFQLIDSANSSAGRIKGAQYSRSMKAAFFINDTEIYVKNDGSRLAQKTPISSLGTDDYFHKANSPIDEFWVKDVNGFSFMRLKDSQNDKTFIGISSVNAMQELSAKVTDVVGLSSDEIVGRIGNMYCFFENRNETTEFGTTEFGSVERSNGFTESAKIVEYGSDKAFLFYTTPTAIKYIVRKKIFETGKYYDGSYTSSGQANQLFVDLEDLNTFNAVSSKLEAVSTVAGIYLSATYTNANGESKNYVICLNNCVQTSHEYNFETMKVLKALNMDTNVESPYTKGVYKLVDSNLFTFIISEDHQLYVVNNDNIVKAVRFNAVEEGMYTDKNSLIYMRPEENQDQYYLQDNAYLQNVLDIQNTENGVLIIDEKGVYLLNIDKNLDCLLFVGDNDHVVRYLSYYAGDGSCGAALVKSDGANSSDIYNIYKNDYTNKDISKQRLRYNYIDLFKTEYQLYTTDDVEYDSSKPIIDFKANFYVTLVDHMSNLFNPKSETNKQARSIEYDSGAWTFSDFKANIGADNKILISPNKYGFKKYVDIITLNDNVQNYISDINETKRIRIVHHKDDKLSFNEVYELILRMVKEEYFEMIKDTKIISRYEYVTGSNSDDVVKNWAPNVALTSANHDPVWASQVDLRETRFGWYYCDGTKVYGIKNDNLKWTISNYKNNLIYANSQKAQAATVDDDRALIGRFDLGLVTKTDISSEIGQSGSGIKWLDIVDVSSEDRDYLMIATNSGFYWSDAKVGATVKMPFVENIANRMYVSANHVRKMSDGTIAAWSSEGSTVHIFNPASFLFSEVTGISTTVFAKIYDVIKLDGLWHVFGVNASNKFTYVKTGFDENQNTSVYDITTDANFTVNNLVDSVNTDNTIFNIYDYSTEKFVFLLTKIGDNKTYRGIYKYDTTGKKFIYSIEETIDTRGIKHILGDKFLSCYFCEVDGHIYGGTNLSIGSFPTIFEYTPSANAISELAHVPFNNADIEDLSSEGYDAAQITMDYSRTKKELFFDKLYNRLYVNNGSLYIKRNTKTFLALNSDVPEGYEPGPVSDPVVYDKTLDNVTYSDFDLYKIVKDSSNNMLWKNVTTKPYEERMIGTGKGFTGAMDDYAITNERSYDPTKDWFVIDRANTNFIPISDIASFIDMWRHINTKSGNNNLPVKPIYRIFKIRFENNFESGNVVNDLIPDTANIILPLKEMYADSTKNPRPVWGFDYYYKGITGNWSIQPGLVTFNPQKQIGIRRCSVVEVTIDQLTNEPQDQGCQYYYTSAPKFVNFNTLTSAERDYYLKNDGTEFKTTNEGAPSNIYTCTHDNVEFMMGAVNAYPVGTVTHVLNKRLTGILTNPIGFDPDTNNVIAGISMYHSNVANTDYVGMGYLTFKPNDTDMLNNNGNRVVQHIPEVMPAVHFKSTKLGLLISDICPTIDGRLGTTDWTTKYISNIRGIKLVSKDYKYVYADYPSIVFPVNVNESKQKHAFDFDKELCFETTNYVFINNYDNADKATYIIDNTSLTLKRVSSGFIVVDITEFEDGNIYGRVIDDGNILRIAKLIVPAEGESGDPHFEIVDNMASFVAFTDVVAYTRTNSTGNKEIYFFGNSVDNKVYRLRKNVFESVFIEDFINFKNIDLDYIKRNRYSSNDLVLRNKFLIPIAGSETGVTTGSTLADYEDGPRRMWYIIDPENMSSNTFYYGAIQRVIDSSKIPNYLGNAYSYTARVFAIGDAKYDVDDVIANDPYTFASENENGSTDITKHSDFGVYEFVDASKQPYYNRYPVLCQLPTATPLTKILKSENSFLMEDNSGHLHYANYKANDNTLMPDTSKIIPIHGNEVWITQSGNGGQRYQLKRTYMTKYGIFGFNGKEVFLNRVNDNNNGYIRVQELELEYSQPIVGEATLYDTKLGIFVAFSGNVYFYNDSGIFERITNFSNGSGLFVDGYVQVTNNHEFYGVPENKRFFDTYNLTDTKLFITKGETDIYLVQNGTGGSSIWHMVTENGRYTFQHLHKSTELVANIKETPLGIYVTYGNTTLIRIDETGVRSIDLTILDGLTQEMASNLVIYDVIYSYKYKTLYAFGNHILKMDSKSLTWKFLGKAGINDQTGEAYDALVNSEYGNFAKALGYYIKADMNKDTFETIRPIIRHVDVYQNVKFGDYTCEELYVLRSRSVDGKEEYVGTTILGDNAKDLSTDYFKIASQRTLPEEELVSLFYQETPVSNSKTSIATNMTSLVAITTGDDETLMYLRDFGIEERDVPTEINGNTIIEKKHFYAPIDNNPSHNTFSDVIFRPRFIGDHVTMKQFKNMLFLMINDSLYIDGIDIDQRLIGDVDTRDKYVGFEYRFIGKSDARWDNEPTAKKSTLSNKFGFREIDLCKWAENSGALPSATNWFKKIIDINNHKTSYFKTDTMAKFYNTVYQHNTHLTKDNMLYNDERNSKPTSFFDISNEHIMEMSKFDNEDFEIELNIFPNLFVVPRKITVSRPFDQSKTSYNKASPFLPYDPFGEQAKLLDEEINNSTGLAQSPFATIGGADLSDMSLLELENYINDLLDKLGNTSEQRYSAENALKSTGDSDFDFILNNRNVDDMLGIKDEPYDASAIKYNSGTLGLTTTPDESTYFNKKVFTTLTDLQTTASSGTHNQDQSELYNKNWSIGDNATTNYLYAMMANVPNPSVKTGASLPNNIKYLAKIKPSTLNDVCKNILGPNLDGKSPGIVSQFSNTNKLIGQITQKYIDRSSELTGGNKTNYDNNIKNTVNKSLYKLQNIITDPMKSNITVGETNYGFTDNDLNNMTLAELEMFINNMTESVNVAQGTDISRVSADTIIENAINNPAVLNNKFYAPYLINYVNSDTVKASMDNYVSEIKNIVNGYVIGQEGSMQYYTGHYDYNSLYGWQKIAAIKSWRFIDVFAVPDYSSWTQAKIEPYLSNHARRLFVDIFGSGKNPYLSNPTSNRTGYNLLISDYYYLFKTRSYYDISNMWYNARSALNSKLTNIYNELDQYVHARCDQICVNELTVANSYYPRSWNIGPNKIANHEYTAHLYSNVAAQLAIRCSPHLCYGNSYIWTQTNQKFFEFSWPGIVYDADGRPDGDWKYLKQIYYWDFSMFDNPIDRYVSILNLMKTRAKTLASKTTGNESYGHKIITMKNIVNNLHTNAVERARRLEKLLSNKI